MAFPHTLVVSNEIPSALAALQERVIRGEQLSEHDITRSVRVDIESGIAVSEVFLSKFIGGNRAISPDAIESIVAQLQAKMKEVLFSNPDLFLAYGKAAAFLARELRRRAAVLHLV
jgi:hypothetical protein